MPFLRHPNNEQSNKYVSNYRYQIEMAEKIDIYNKYRNKSVCCLSPICVQLCFRIVIEINGKDGKRHDREH